MNLEFVCKYKSIDSIEVPQLPNFTILTGLNGSGKTHLLEAIKNGSIKVSDFQKDEIVLYNYATFNIKDQNLIYDQTITQNIKNTRVKISQLKQNDDQYKTLYNKLSNPTPTTLKELNINDESLANSIAKELKANNINFLDLKEDEQNNLIKTHADLNNLLIDNLSYTFLSYSESLKKVSQSSIFGGKKYNDTELLKKWDNDSPWAFLNKLFKEYGLKHTINSPNKDSDNYTFTARINIGDEIISFSDLSSGEKILCHLALLMFKSKYIKPKLLLLDEVDTNLHPSMIKNLINVINKVFVEKGTKVVLVTHSPTTVALADKDSIYEFKNNEIKNITQHKAIDILSEGLMLFDKEIRYIQNALNTNKKLVLITEGDNNKFIEKAIKTIDESLLENTHIVKRAESITGDKQLKLFYDFFVAINPSIKILIVWDCDCVVYKSLESKNNVTPFVFEQNKNNNKVKKGVENLFCKDIFSQTFYDTNTTLDDYGCEKINQIFNKKRFLDHILTMNNKEDFSNFKPLINLIAELIQCPK